LSALHWGQQRRYNFDRLTPANGEGEEWKQDVRQAMKSMYETPEGPVQPETSSFDDDEISQAKTLRGVNATKANEWREALAESAWTRYHEYLQRKKTSLSEISDAEVTEEFSLDCDAEAVAWITRQCAPSAAFKSLRISSRR